MHDATPLRLQACCNTGAIATSMVSCLDCSALRRHDLSACYDNRLKLCLLLGQRILRATLAQRNEFQVNTLTRQIIIVAHKRAQAAMLALAIVGKYGNTGNAAQETRKQSRNAELKYTIAGIIPSCWAQSQDQCGSAVHPPSIQTPSLPRTISSSCLALSYALLCVPPHRFGDQR